MLCQRCQQNEATVHVQQIMNNQKTELHLCAECASQMEAPIMSFDQFFQALIDVFSAMPDINSSTHNPHSDRTCTSCGLTFDNFRNSGKFGCASCYSAFKKELDIVLKNIQGSNRHSGKIPQRTGVELLKTRRLGELRAELKKAIEVEQYEEAARIRDLIKEMEGSA